MPYQVTGSSMKWVGENSPKPATKLGFGNVTLSRLKAAGIVVVSRELMTFSAPGSEQALQQILLNELTAFVDSALLGAAAASASRSGGYPRWCDGVGEYRGDHLGVLHRETQGD